MFYPLLSSGSAEKKTESVPILWLHTAKNGGRERRGMNDKKQQCESTVEEMEEEVKQRRKEEDR